MPEFRAPVGTRDVLPPESDRWAALVAVFARRARLAGYGLAVSPMFEDAGLFARGMGETTDVVRKEMYDFDDKGGRRMALRPEGTASVVRAFVQHRPTTPFKAWYAAPSFRYERPQAGRYRQHHQLGIEAIGSADPEVDVEVVAFQAGFYRQLGLERVELRVNSLGDHACRPAYRAALVAHFEARRDALCDEHRDRVAQNPLRVLDCKRPPCVAASAGAPRTVDHLCAECADHFRRVGAGLTSLGVAFSVDPGLVRGLDYYTRTTWEFTAAALESAQNGIGGGGRYDGLVETLGGPPTPGVGFGTGVERVLLACDAEDVFAAAGPRVDVFVIDTTGGDVATELAHRLREAGIATDRAFDGRSMKAQFKAADRSGARLALVVGDSERAEGVVQLRDLAAGGQEAVASGDVVDRVRKAMESR